MSAEAKQRVVEEQAELLARAEKLGDFMESPAFLAISSVQQSLLTQQAVLMASYWGVLGLRLQFWGNN